MREDAEKIKQNIEALGLDERDLQQLQKALKHYSRRRTTYAVLIFAIAAFSVMAIVVFFKLHSMMTSCEMKISDIFRPIMEKQEMEVAFTRSIVTTGIFTIFCMCFSIWGSILCLITVCRDHARSRIDLKIIENFKKHQTGSTAKEISQKVL